MSNTIAWKFEGLPTVYRTPEAKFDITVTSLKHSNNLHHSHKIEILNGNHTTTEPVANDVPVSNSPNNTKKRKSVSKSAEQPQFVAETPIVRSLLDDVDHTNPESDLL